MTRRSLSKKTFPNMKRIGEIHDSTRQRFIDHEAPMETYTMKRESVGVKEGTLLPSYALNVYNGAQKKLMTFPDSSEQRQMMGSRTECKVKAKIVDGVFVILKYCL